MDSHGRPSVGDVFLFLAGAVLGFGTLGLLAHGPLANRRSIDRRRDRVLAGALDWAAVGAAVGVVALLAGVHGWVAWPLASFIGTVVYLVGAGLQLGLVAARDEALASQLSGERCQANTGVPSGAPAKAIHRRRGLDGPGTDGDDPAPEAVRGHK